MGSEVDQARLRRVGLIALSPERGLALMDFAQGQAEALLAPIQFDASVLRAQSELGVLPPALSRLVRGSRRRKRDAGALLRRLEGVAAEERESVLLEFVRGQVATVLGLASAAEVEPSRVFRDLGFDSLAAVEFRNNLVAASGLRLPPTLVFDYPSAEAVAAFLGAEVGLGGSRVSAAGGAEEVALREALARLPIARLREAGLIEPLMELIDDRADPTGPAENDLIEEIDTMQIEDLVRRTVDGSGVEAEVGGER